MANEKQGFAAANSAKDSGLPLHWVTSPFKFVNKLTARPMHLQFEQQRLPTQPQLWLMSSISTVSL
jgi:hypothetical protein